MFVSNISIIFHQFVFLYSGQNYIIRFPKFYRKFCKIGVNKLKVAACTLEKDTNKQRWVVKKS